MTPEPPDDGLMFSQEWTDLPGDPDIGSQYILQPGIAWEDYERLIRKPLRSAPIDFPEGFTIPATGGNRDMTTDERPVLKPLKEAVARVLEERYGPMWRYLPRPEGLRLEVHPLLHRRLMQDPEGWGGSWGSLAEQFQVPVRITTDLPGGTWRLAIITEDVLGRGHL